MDPADFANFQKDASAALVKFVKTAKTLSSGDVSFNKSLDSEFGTTLDHANGKILGMINDLMRNASEGSDLKFDNLEDADSVETRWSVISEVVDLLLEKADMCMDEYTGTVNRGVMQTTSTGNNYKAARADKRTPETRKAFRSTLNIPKPQLQFKKQVSPLDSSPFKPLLSQKPHAVKSLEESLVPEVVGEREKYPHPYQDEIMQYEFPERVRKVSEPTKYHPFESTSAIWVDTLDVLNDMVEQLSKAEEIAVDLEHHDFRTYIGLVCLMQISTRDQDWIIDTLKLRDELEILNKVFADPNIVKVFHGAFMDIIWLQRDLGLYVVGLFDTYEAARSLGFTGHGLAFLLKKYIDFDADKSYQLADWRVRPIPKEMLNYARSDTHFLLYIYDNVRNELIEKSNDEENKIDTVMKNSKETSLKIYDTEPYDTTNGNGSRGWLSILKNNPIYFSDEQFSTFKAVHAWRDQVAREEDDNPNFILSRNQLLSLARQMPTDTGALLGVVNTPVLRARRKELVSMIQEAKANPIPFTSIQHLLNATAKYWTPQAKKDETMTDVNPMPMLGPEDAKAKTEESKFWGKTFGGSRWEVKDLVNEFNDISLALPLPHLTAKIMEDGSQDASSIPMPRPSYVKERASKDELPDIVTVKQLGGGRKRKLQDVVEDGLDASNETTSQPSSPTSAAPVASGENMDEDEEDADTLTISKAEKRAAKKAEKKRKKEEAKQKAAEGSSENGEYQPFDYTSAPSVMNAKKDVESTAFDGGKKYADGPKGMRSRRREKEGKSFHMKA